MPDKCKNAKIFQKTIALLCIITMVFCFLPSNVFANEIRQIIETKERENEKEVITEKAEVMQAEKYDIKSKKILLEETEKRTANEKHFLLEDGTNLVAIYTSNIHYKENGKYIDVDNTLEEKEDKNELFKILDKDQINEGSKDDIKNQIIENLESKKATKIYENKSNSYKSRFTNKTNGYKIGSIQSNGYTVTWGLKNSKTSIVNVKNPKENTKEKGKYIDEIELNQIASEIEYKDILSDININYIISPESIKENIILSNEQALKNEIVFEYYTNGLKMKLQKDNSIILYKDNEKNVLFTIKTPFMYDAKLEITDKIELKLTEEEGKYILKILPNLEWIKSEKRVFPITIDPTIQTSLYVQNINDTYIYNGDTNNTGRYLAHILRIGNGGGPSSRTLIKFGLPTELKSGDQIIAAELSLCNYPDTTEWNPPTAERIFDVHKITSNWSSSTANWSNMSTKYNNRVIDYIKYKYDSNNPRKDNRFEITQLVKDWYTTGNNYGVMIKEHNEQLIETGTDAYFYASDIETTYASYRPKVIMAYRNQTGIEDYLSYHTQSVGRAGQVFTNDYNGNLTLIHTDASTPGTRFPATIKHIYNTNEKDIDIGYGKGQRLNLSQTLELLTLSSQEYLKYIDEDATAHYFIKNSATDIYKDEDGLGLEVKMSGTNAIMTDKSGNTMTFVKYASGNRWHLKEIKDTNDNKITLTLTTSGSNYLITKLDDGAGDRMSLVYSSGTLQKIVDCFGRETHYTYNNSKCLTKITYSDDKTSNYTYGNNNQLTQVKNVDNSYINYSYYAGQVYRVKNIEEYGTDGTQGKALNITYANNLTKFVDNNGYANTYAFNNYGHCTSIADFGKEAENIDKAYGKKYEYATNGSANNKLTLESKLISIKDIPNNLVVNSDFNNGFTNWNKVNCTSNEQVVSLNGNNVAKMVGDPTRNKYIVQDINISGEKGDIFTLYGWAKSNGIQKNDGNYKSARYTVRVTKTDGINQWIDIPVTLGTDGWQFISKQFKTNGSYSSIGVYLIFYGNANEIYFDNVGIFKEEFGESYQYDSNGNLISSQDLAKQNSTFNYSGNNDLLKNINPKGGSFTYEYDYIRKGRLLKALDTAGTQYLFNYNTYGETTSIKVEESNRTDLLESGNTYYAKSAYSNKYLDIKGVSTADNALLQNYNLAVENANQQFTFTKIEGDSYYKITPMHAQDKALYFDETDENKIKQKTYENNDKFKWKLIENLNGTYRIENKAKPDNVITLKEEKIENEILFDLQKWEGKLTQCIYLYNSYKQEECANMDLLESGEVYYIKSKNSGLYWMHESDESGAQVKQAKYEGKNAKQLWRIIRETDRTYRIIPLGSKYGNALYPKENKNAQNQKIGIKTYVGDISQKWHIVKNNNGTYTISTKVSGDAIRCIRTLDNSKVEGAELVLNTSGDQYYLEKANLLPDLEEGAAYTLKAKVSNLYLGVNGTNVEQQELNNQNTQKWILHKESEGYYSLKLAADETKTMDLTNGSTANSTNIQIKTSNGTDSEKFEIVPVGNETYMIKPKNGKGATCVEISGGSNATGANVQNYETNHTASQFFYLTKVNSANTDKYIESKAIYTENGNYMTQLQDQLGNATNYTYSSTRNLATQTDPKGNTINYTYDNLDRLTAISTTTNNKTYQNTYTYENDKLKTITHNGFTYTFIYDSFGNQKQVKVGVQNLITNEYGTRNGNLTKSTYGNGNTVSYGYDRFNRITSKSLSGGTYTYLYDGRGNLKTITDSTNNNTITYTYDMAERLIKGQNSNGYEYQYEYDKNSNLSKIIDTINGENKETIYNYDLNNNINNVKLYNDTYIINHYDTLLRTAQKQIKTENGSYNTNITYLNVNGTNRTSTQIKSIKNSTDVELNYTYDNNGNIETISNGTELRQKYYYDGLNQLIREDNKDLNKTITYTYDNGGNIINKKDYAYTTEATLTGEAVQTINYGYGNENWKDQMTSYDNKPITYDEIGNPLTYNGNTYTWQNGRQLSGIINTTNNLNITYQYNDNGIRAQKTVNGITTTYYLRGTKVIFEKTGNDTIYYIYDSTGSLIGLRYNENQYYYKKNIQGDIIGILDNNLEEVVKYTYDSWGKIVSITDEQGNQITDPTHIGNINPYRYREYRYDSETGLYYLQSRYYNPEWGRFINFDNYGGQIGLLLSHNGYAYCGNNPANMLDNKGNFAVVIGSVGWTAIKALLATVGVTVGSLIGGAIADEISNAREKVTTKENVDTVPKQEEKKVQYWAADKNANKQEPISYVQAQIRVARGKNIIANNQISALRVAVCYPVRRLEINKNKEKIIGYYWHYHVSMNYDDNNIHRAPHIWFEGPKLFDY